MYMIYAYEVGPEVWATSALYSCISHMNAWANLHLLGQPNTLLATGGGPVDAAVAHVDADGAVVRVQPPRRRVPRRRELHHLFKYMQRLAGGMHGGSARGRLG